jgi:hypothetical protein
VRAVERRRCEFKGARTFESFRGKLFNFPVRREFQSDIYPDGFGSSIGGQAQTHLFASRRNLQELT